MKMNILRAKKIREGASPEYQVYSIDPDDGIVSRDGAYSTWQEAYDTLGDGGARVRGSSNNFVYDGKTLMQVYKYKNTGRSGKWSGASYDVVWSREISEDPRQYIADHFTADSWVSCEFNEGANEDNAAPKTYVLSYKDNDDIYYCTNKYGDWTTHIEDAWEGSGEGSFSDEMKHNFAEVVGAEVDDLEVRAIEKFEAKEETGHEPGLEETPVNFAKGNNRLAVLNRISNAPLSKKDWERFNSSTIGRQLGTLDKLSDEKLKSRMHAILLMMAKKYRGGIGDDIDFGDEEVDMYRVRSFLRKCGISIPDTYRYDLTHILMDRLKEVRDYFKDELEVRAIEKFEAKEIDARTLIAAAAKSAWSSSGATDFKLNITKLDDCVRIRAMGPKGEDNIGIWWVVSLDEDAATIAIDQYTDWDGDKKPYEQEPERTWTVKGYDELESELEDDFKALQETLDVAKQ